MNTFAVQYFEVSPFNFFLSRNNWEVIHVPSLSLHTRTFTKVTTEKLKTVNNKFTFLYDNLKLYFPWHKTVKTCSILAPKGTN